MVPQPAPRAWRHADQVELSLPDAGALLRLQEVLAIGNRERGVPRVDITQRPDNAKPRRRMRIRRQLSAHGVVALLVAPALCVAEEEALITGEAVKDFRLLSVERL